MPIRKGEMLGKIKELFKYDSKGSTIPEGMRKHRDDIAQLQSNLMHFSNEYEAFKMHVLKELQQIEQKVGIIVQGNQIRDKEISVLQSFLVNDEKSPVIVNLDEEMERSERDTGFTFKKSEQPEDTWPKTAAEIKKYNADWRKLSKRIANNPVPVPLSESEQPVLRSPKGEVVIKGSKHNPVALNSTKHLNALYKNVAKAKKKK